MAAFYNAIWSLVPHRSLSVHPIPKVGDQAPTEPKLAAGVPNIVSFPRHCGCPFAQKEVLGLGELTQREKDLHVVIVQHSPENVTKEWFESIGGPKAFGDDSSRYTLVADSSRNVHALWGVGRLGWTNVLFDGSALSKVKELKKENIGVSTFSGSDRWQNSGGFAIDPQGKVTWNHLASVPSDICNWEEALKSFKA